MSLKVESMFWCVLNVHFNHINYGWCLYNNFGTIGDQKCDFGGVLGGFSKREPIFWVPMKQGVLGEQVSRCGEMCIRTHVVLCIPTFWGCFWTSLSVSYVMFWCCFDELKLCKHTCLKLNELFDFETNFDDNMNMNLE